MSNNFNNYYDGDFSGGKLGTSPLINGIRQINNDGVESFCDVTVGLYNLLNDGTDDIELSEGYGTISFLTPELFLYNDLSTMSAVPIEEKYCNGSTCIICFAPADGISSNTNFADLFLAVEINGKRTIISSNPSNLHTFTDSFGEKDGFSTFPSLGSSLLLLFIIPISQDTDIKIISTIHNAFVA